MKANAKKNNLKYLIGIMMLGLCGILVLSFLTRKEPIYRSSASVKILEHKSIAGLLTEWIVYEPANMMESQQKAITGISILTSTAKRMGLLDDRSSKEKINQVVSDLQSRISADILGQTNIIQITAYGRTPQDAMNLANNVAHAYIDENLKEKRTQFQSSCKFIEEQLDHLEAKLSKSEERVANAKLIKPLQDKLVNLEVKLSILAPKYTENHPAIMQLEEQIEELRQQLSSFQEDDLRYEKIVRDLEVNKELYTMFKTKLEEARIAEAQKVPDVTMIDPAELPRSPVSFPGRVVSLLRKW